MNEERKFLFKLCHHLGYKSVRELENTMSYIELKEWAEYFALEKFLPDRLEQQLAVISELIYKGKFDGDVTALDFMPSISDEYKEAERKARKQREIIDKMKGFG